MTPKEKAEYLTHTFATLNTCHQGVDSTWEYDKECALICVNEIINTDILIPGRWHEIKETARLGYWEDVKEEINKL